nr:MAG TPA: hypothetical protein [Caudoviricetes sp.]
MMQMPITGAFLRSWQRYMDGRMQKLITGCSESMDSSNGWRDS